MLSDIEEVARIIFSPRMIHNGVLLPEAFKLREVIGEEYLSVLRTSIDGWRDDALRIPQRPNRRLYGFAEMKVGDIRQAAFINVRFDVLDCATESMPSHAGIFICVGDEYNWGIPVEESTRWVFSGFLTIEYTASSCRDCTKTFTYDV